MTCNNKMVQSVILVLEECVEYKELNTKRKFGQCRRIISPPTYGVEVSAELLSDDAADIRKDSGLVLCKLVQQRE